MAFALALRNTPVVDMNITPLVDVMLVLLIIFMVTMPMRTYPLAIDLPQNAPIPPPPPPVQPIKLRIGADGQVAWNGSAMPMAALEGALQVEAARYATPKDQPVVQIDTDADAKYGALTQVLAAARNAGMEKVGFVDAGTR